MMYGWEKAGKRIKSSSKNAIHNSRQMTMDLQLQLHWQVTSAAAKSASLIASFCCPLNFPVFPLFPFPLHPLSRPRKHCLGGKEREQVGERKSVKFDTANTHSTASQPCFNSLLS